MEALYITGYFDEVDEEWNDSETQGPGSINAADNPDTNRRYWDEVDVNQMTFCHRTEDDAQILRRWHGQPDDVLDELGQIEADDERGVWVERMTAFRETQLRSLLKKYFDADDYMSRELVLRWEQKNGRWVPAEKMVVAEWVAAKIEEKGSRLSGFASCAGTIRSKITRRAVSKDARHDTSWWKEYNAS